MTPTAMRAELTRVRALEPSFLRTVAEEALVAQMAEAGVLTVVRERALALGWVPYGSWWGRSPRARKPIVWKGDAPRGEGLGWAMQWAVNFAGPWTPGTQWYSTEDDALSAALELRDVRLS